METEILQHKISYWIGEEKDNIELDECDIEHITDSITQGFSEGGLNHGEEEIRGWWKIVK